MEILDRQERLFIDPEREHTVTHGDMPGVVAVATKEHHNDYWSWAVHDVLRTHRGRQGTLGEAEAQILATIHDMDQRNASSAHALTERQHDDAEFEHERLNYLGGDAELAGLYRRYNVRASSNANRAISQNSYITSGQQTRDEAALAALRVKIEDRKAELARREAA